MRRDNRRPSPKTNSSDRAFTTRRKLLLAGALGGTTGLAGCAGFFGEDDDEAETGDGNGGGDGGSTQTEPPGDLHVEGQDLRLPTPNNPEEMYFAWQIGNEIDSRYSAPADVYSAIMEPGIWGRFYNSLYWPLEVPNAFGGLYEDWEITSDTISITIRDDATWSDGEPVRAKDAIGNHAVWKEAPQWAPAPTETRFHIGAIGDYSMPDGPDGKTYELHVVDNDEWDEFGGFDPYGEGEIMSRIGSTSGVFSMRAGPAFPTHLGPYEDAVDEAIEIWDEKPDDLEGLVLQHVTSDWDEEIHEWSRDPENIVSHGPWTVADVRGAQEVVLEPNEHSRHAEDINYDRVVFEYNEGEQRVRAGIQEEHLDYGQMVASPEETQAIPDTYQQELSPSGAGYSLGLNHNSFFGDRLVRQAIMFALDKSSIAQNIHPDTTSPITTPGFHHWGVDDIIDESWAEENLIDYSQDLDRAESLMQEAGFEMQDGIWHRDGEPFQQTIATSRETPVFETTVVDQLQEFGIDIEFQTYDDADFTERVRGSNEPEYIEEEYGGEGDFDIWTSAGPEDLHSGHFDALWHRAWWWAVANCRRVRRRNYWDHETQEEALSQYASNGWVRGNYPLWEDWLVDVPPIGEPDGEPEPFQPGVVWGEVRTGPKTFDSAFEDNEYYNPPDGGSLEYYSKKFAWTLNWWLPVLPLVLEQNQHFVNTGNWVWPTDHEMWDTYFGQGWNGDELAGMNRIFADPDNPKDDANVTEK